MAWDKEARVLVTVTVFGTGTIAGAVYTPASADSAHLRVAAGDAVYRIGEVDVAGIVPAP